MNMINYLLYGLVIGFVVLFLYKGQPLTPIDIIVMIIAITLGIMGVDILKKKFNLEGFNAKLRGKNNLKKEEKLGKYNNKFSNKFEYGYAYLNTDKWSVPMYRSPVCKTEKQCTICESNTSGYPLNLKQWNNSTKITPPSEINLDYLKEELK